ncbi:hypothetical protein [Vagococcus acidifermentans]|uniref:hypothetical protein n=1 Tax=Vagococcus acidifermentans TaxID=564710 RepID=UPI0014769CAE|nr:hypothetical protein [Vagococcus acidifermentans]
MFDEKSGDIFEGASRKKSDDDWLNVVAYVFLVCVVLVELFFVLPAVLSSVSG